MPAATRASTRHRTSSIRSPPVHTSAAAAKRSRSPGHPSRDNSPFKPAKKSTLGKHSQTHARGRSGNASTFPAGTSDAASNSERIGTRSRSHTHAASPTMLRAGNAPHSTPSAAAKASKPGGGVKSTPMKRQRAGGAAAARSFRGKRGSAARSGASPAAPPPQPPSGESIGGLSGDPSMTAVEGTVPKTEPSSQFTGDPMSMEVDSPTAAAAHPDLIVSEFNGMDFLLPDSGPQSSIKSISSTSADASLPPRAARAASSPSLPVAGASARRAASRSSSVSCIPEFPTPFSLMPQAIPPSAASSVGPQAGLHHSLPMLTSPVNNTLYQCALQLHQHQHPHHFHHHHSRSSTSGDASVAYTPVITHRPLPLGPGAITLSDLAAMSAHHSHSHGGVAASGHTSSAISPALLTLPAGPLSGGSQQNGGGFLGNSVGNSLQLSGCGTPINANPFLVPQGRPLSGGAQHHLMHPPQRSMTDPTLVSGGGAHGLTPPPWQHQPPPKNTGRNEFAGPGTRRRSIVGTPRSSLALSITATAGDEDDECDGAEDMETGEDANEHGAATAKGARGKPSARRGKAAATAAAAGPDNREPSGLLFGDGGTPLASLSEGGEIHEAPGASVSGPTEAPADVASATANLAPAAPATQAQRRRAGGAGGNAGQKQGSSAASRRTGAGNKQSRNTANAASASADPPTSARAALAAARNANADVDATGSSAPTTPLETPKRASGGTGGASKASNSDGKSGGTPSRRPRTRSRRALSNEELDEDEEDFMRDPDHVPDAPIQNDSDDSGDYLGLGGSLAGKGGGTAAQVAAQHRSLQEALEREYPDFNKITDKRQRRLIKNRLAAKACRQKKKEHMETLETTIKQLQKKVSNMEAEVGVLRRENERLIVENASLRNPANAANSAGPASGPQGGASNQLNASSARGNNIFSVAGREGTPNSGPTMNAPSDAAELMQPLQHMPSSNAFARGPLPPLPQQGTACDQVQQQAPGQLHDVHHQGHLPGIVDSVLAGAGGLHPQPPGGYDAQGQHHHSMLVGSGHPSMPSYVQMGQPNPHRFYPGGTAPVQDHHLFQAPAEAHSPDSVPLRGRLQGVTPSPVMVRQVHKEADLPELFESEAGIGMSLTGPGDPTDAHNVLGNPVIGEEPDGGRSGTKHDDMTKPASTSDSGALPSSFFNGLDALLEAASAKSAPARAAGV